MTNSIFIIAELGVNWDTFNKCLDMISYSKTIGVDSIKLQMYNEDNIKYIEDNDIKIRLQKMILTPELIRIFYNFTKKLELNFIITVMYPQAYDILRKNKIKLDFIKIRYADRFNYELAQATVKYAQEFNIPIIISCDMSEGYFSNEYKAEELDIIPMYCVPKYPADVKDINLNPNNLYNFEGYSNHVPNKYIPIVAIARGMEYIEVHVMSDISCIDFAVSLTFSELKDICKFRNEYQKLNINYNNINKDIPISLNTSIEEDTPNTTINTGCA